LEVVQKRRTRLRAGYFTQGEQTVEWTTYDKKAKV
jgi:hypothetical protein